MQQKRTTLPAGDALAPLRVELKKLDSGYVGKLVEIFEKKYTAGHIRMVLYGQRKNRAIVDAALALLHQLRAEEEKLQAELAQLTKP